MAEGITKYQGEGAEHYVSPRKKRGKGETKMQPPLTPMIDVTFQLLLFFLLTMTFRLEEGMIPGALPQKGQGEPTDPLVEPITVRLVATGENKQDVNFLIDGANVTMQSGQELLAYFKGRIENLGGSTDSPVIIAPQGEVRWRWVVEVFNQAHAAKFKEVGFAPASG